MKACKWKLWEIALLTGFALAALTAGWLSREQSALADKVVRLHVVANSDSPEDQRVKLRVRDAVLEESAPLLEGLDRDGAVDALERALPALTRRAAEVLEGEGFSYPVQILVARTYFPTKVYEDFSLPAGQYTSLQVKLGDAKGQNWWCVVFPPLCMGSVKETAAQCGLDDSQLALITGENEGYVVKFKLMELWEELKNRL